MHAFSPQMHQVRLQKKQDRASSLFTKQDDESFERKASVRGGTKSARAVLQLADEGATSFSRPTIALASRAEAPLHTRRTRLHSGEALDSAAAAGRAATLVLGAATSPPRPRAAGSALTLHSSAASKAVSSVTFDTGSANELQA